MVLDVEIIDIFLISIICPFLMKSIHLDPRFRKFNKFPEKEASKPQTKAKLNIFNFKGIFLIIEEKP